MNSRLLPLLAVFACKGDEDTQRGSTDIPWDTQEWESPFEGPFEVDCDTMPTATLPVAAPFARPTDAQIEEVDHCELLDLIYELGYAGSTCPETACEWAAATVLQVITDPGYGATYQFPAAEGSLAELVRLNPAFLLNDYVLSSMFFSDKAQAPPAPDNPITGVTLTYDWTGMGDPVQWDIAMTDADTEPVVTGTVGGEPWTGSADREDIQALGTAFQDLIAIDEWVNVTPCWDLYPDWTMQITWADGTVRDLATYTSNLMFAGGPWETEIDGQRYLQTSPAMVEVVVDLADALDLPVGEPYIFGCGSIEPPLIEQAYPSSFE